MKAVFLQKHKVLVKNANQMMFSNILKGITGITHSDSRQCSDTGYKMK
jgi:hypothetical protein